MNQHTTDTEMNSTQNDREANTRALAAELIEAEIRAAGRRVEQMLSQISADTAAVRERMATLRKENVGRDAGLTRRFAEFGDAMGVVEMLLRDGLGEAWNQARSMLVDAGRPRLYNPGEPAPASGEYEIIDARGRATGEERTVVQGRPLPPTPESDQRYMLSHPARNGAGTPN